MDILSLILWPIKWVIELILVAFHSMWTFFGLDPDAGLTWVLSIVGLVIVVRAALIPIFVRQIKSQRRMLEVAPQLKKIQDKYKGKKDQYSREAMSRETMELYKKTGTNPLSSCLPLLLQMPIFFGLFSVLNDASARQGRRREPHARNSPTRSPTRSSSALRSTRRSSRHSTTAVSRGRPWWSRRS